MRFPILTDILKDIDMKMFSKLIDSGVRSVITTLCLCLQCWCFSKVLVSKATSLVVDNLWQNVFFYCSYNIFSFGRQFGSWLRRLNL